MGQPAKFAYATFASFQTGSARSSPSELGKEISFERFVQLPAGVLKTHSGG